ncbi:MAG: hypothetical protein HOL98_13890 [Gammaproteobacteria bacterium]|jgi:hypothetical protein|nr:hypothetical protein [Gammaproteobacteria bacterium]MBT5204544.1 hypothetical protein [Gammaproteobacteria bacterium]MBT6247238.1 hypothetical protein [Gammaproteobacteria bacterium]
MRAKPDYRSQRLRQTGGIMLLRLICLSIVLLFNSGSLAHHSRAAVDLNLKAEVIGTVDLLTWRNPHIFISVSGTDKQGNNGTWVLEGHSISGMLNHGWRKDSIKVGDRVTAIFSPNRKADIKNGLIDHFIREDGKHFYAFKSAPDDKNFNPKFKKPIKPSKDFSGNWSYPRSLLSVLVSGAPDYSRYALSAQGKAMLEAFDPSVDPDLKCESRGLPNLALYVYGYRWKRFGDRIEIEKEQAIIAEEHRTIYLNADQVPEQKPSMLGLSVGHFEEEGQLLVVETSNFLATTWGITEGIDSSSSKRVLEHYRLTNGGLRMQVSILVEDPVYLDKPFRLYGVYDKKRDREFVHSPCDIEVAQEHLKYE